MLASYILCRNLADFLSSGNKKTTSELIETAEFY